MYLEGTEGADSLVGGADDDTIKGNGGNDTIHAGGGDDVLAGGDGGDLIYGEAGDDAMTSGLDLLADTLYGGDGNDSMVGGQGGDLLDGGAGNDDLQYDSGCTVLGGAGDDHVRLADPVQGSMPFEHTYLDGGTGADWAEVGGGDVWIDRASATGIELHNFERITLSDFVVAHGSDHADVIEGADSTTIYGGDGDDTLTAGGFGLTQGGIGDDTIVLNNGTLDGGGGRDVLDCSMTDGSNVDLSSTSEQSDGFYSFTLTGFEDIVGSSMGDGLTGSAGDNLLRGMGGDDVLYASGGHDTLDGGGGVDLVSFVKFGQGVTVDLAAGSVAYAGGGATALVGVEQVQGSHFNDTFIASSGDDLMDGLAEGGGKEVDTVSYAKAEAGVTVDLSKFYQAQDTGGSGVDTLGVFQALIGSDFGDLLTGFTGANTIQAGAGDDTVIATAGADKVDGGGGFDTLLLGTGFVDHGMTVDYAKHTATMAGEGVTTFSGVEWIAMNEDSRDTFIASSGNDGGDGGDGIDTLSYETAAAGITFNLASHKAQDTGGAGVDRFFGFEVLNGSKFADVLTAAAGTSIYGMVGDDLLYSAKQGGASAYGGDGNDTLVSGHGDDVLDGGLGRDMVSYAGAKGAVTVTLITGAGSATGDGHDTFSSIQDVTGSAFADHLSGDALDNLLIGGRGADVIMGGDADDELQGGAGNDKLTGGNGHDTLTGGAGGDTFIFAALGESSKNAPDLITDLDRKDAIDLSKIDADTTQGGDQAFVLVDAFGHHAGEARITYDAGNDLSRLDLDVNGDAVADASIMIQGDARHFTGLVL